MKKIFFILIILNFACFNFSAVAMATSAEELREACENEPVSPKLAFYSSYGKLQYNTSYTRDNLTQLGRNMGMFEAGDLASGLALVDVASEYELSVMSRKMINGSACLFPQELSVYIGFQNPVIYLANDLKPDSCLYNLVVRHEKIHQQINVNALEYFIPIIYQKIKRIVSEMRPLYVSHEHSIKEGTNELTNFYAKKIDALVEEFKKEILIEQQKLDNRQHYQLESDVCKLYNKKHPN